MSEFLIYTERISTSAGEMKAMGTTLKNISGGISGVKDNLRGILPGEQAGVIARSLGVIIEDVNDTSRKATAASGVLMASRQLYMNADQKVLGKAVRMNKKAGKKGSSHSTGLETSLIKAFSDEYSWKDVIKSFGNIGKTAGQVISMFTAKSWKDWLKIAVGTGTTGYKIYKDIVNYSKIGRAVGGKTAAAWFLKKQIGLRNVGYASKCKSPLARFRNNLKNTTSPYNLKDAFSPLTGKKGAGACVAAWAGVALTGVVNAVDNYQEYKTSGGKMSKGRMVAETISETVIDTVTTYAATAVVGAAITAATGVVAAPAVVAIATGVGLAAINAGVKSLTGKSATEFISDGILDGGKAIYEGGKKAVTGAKKAAKAVAGWFKKKKLSFA